MKKSRYGQQFLCLMKLKLAYWLQWKLSLRCCLLPICLVNFKSLVRVVYTTKMFICPCNHLLSWKLLQHSKCVRSHTCEMFYELFFSPVLKSVYEIMNKPNLKNSCLKLFIKVDHGSSFIKSWLLAIYHCLLELLPLSVWL